MEQINFYEIQDQTKVSENRCASGIQETWSNTGRFTNSDNTAKEQNTKLDKSDKT